MMFRSLAQVEWGLSSPANAPAGACFHFRATSHSVAHASRVMVFSRTVGATVAAAALFS